MEYLSLLPATVLGYLTFRATAHPSSRIRKKLPNVRVKRVQVFPVIRVFMFGRVFHFHHWFNFSLLLASSAFLSIAALDSLITRGILLGGVIHGLTLPKEHRRIIYKDFSLERLTSIN